MAVVRFYLPSEGSPPITPAFDGSWQISGEAQRRELRPYRSGTSLGFGRADEASSSVSDVLILQSISEPLPAQTISGTVQGVIFAIEDATAADLRSQMVIRVVSNDGSTVRGTLLALDNSGLSNEWSATSFVSRMFPVGAISPASLSSLAISDGDRLVVEVGYRAHNTSATNHDGILVTRDNAPWDVVASEGNNSGTNSWIEFSSLTLNTQFQFTDAIASAVDVLPPDGETHFVHNGNFASFTTEADDPSEIGPYTTSGNIAYTGWIKLVADADCSVRLSSLGTSIVNTQLMFVYDEVPTAASVAVASNGAYPNPTTLIVPLTSGTTYYVVVLPYDAEFWSTDEDRSVQLRVDRNDSIGTLQDVIADATDRFPSSSGTETLTDTRTFWAFTAETDDPDEIDAWYGQTTSTGWLKLVIPTDASVSFSMVDPSTTSDSPYYACWLYDEVPTSPSVAVAFDEGDDPLISGRFYLPEVSLTTGTYYLAVSTYDWTAITDLTVKIRWEAAPTIETFDLDAVLLRTMAPGDVNVERMPTVIDSTTVTSASPIPNGSTLTIDVPAGAQYGDLLVSALVWDQRGVTGIFVGRPPGWSIVNGSQAATTDEGISVAFFIWDGLRTSYTWTVFPNNTARVAAMVAIRDAGAIDQVNSIAQTFGAPYSTVGASPVYNNFVNDPTDNYYFLFLGFMGSSSGGVITWTPADSGSPPDDGAVTDIAQDSAVNNASIYAQWRVSRWRFGTIGFLGAPSTSQPINIAAAMRVRGTYRTQLFLSAFVGHGFTMNAVIQAAIHTTHLRTGPHYGQHPSYVVITSAVLGANPIGTDLNTILADLDARITAKETKT